MKAILIVDMPTDCEHCDCSFDDTSYGFFCSPLKRGIFGRNDKPSWCPLKHPLKYASNDFYIYDTKYLMENLDREIELLKGVKEFESNTCN